MPKLNNIKRMGYSRGVLGILGIFLLISIPILAPFSFQTNSVSRQMSVSILAARAQATAQTCTVSGPNLPTGASGLQNGSGGCVLSNGSTYTAANTGYTITNDNNGGFTDNNNNTMTATPTQTLFCNAASTCIASVVYVFTVPIMTVFAYIGAYVFDIAVQLSLNSSTYALNFLTSSWAVVRDFANMAFIFILVYLAVTIMFNAESVGTMKILATTIIMALLINFSFFITRVVIDAGNILAVQFYNAIQAPTLSGTTAGTVATTVSNYTPFANSFSANTKDLTASIMQALQAQNLLGAASFQVATQTNSGWNQFLVNLITIILIYLSIAAILAMLAFAFLTVGFKFVIRIVALWFVIIAAPAAFAVRSLLYSKSSQPKKWWGQWFSALLQWTFYPAIFLFMFLIMTVIMSALGGCPTGVSSTTQCGLIPSIFSTTTGIQGLSNVSSFSAIGIAIANVALRLGIVLIMLYYGLKVADMIVQQGTSSASAASNWVGRKLGSLTYGGAAFAARQTVGRGAYSASQSKWASKMEASSPLFGGTARRGLAGVASSRLDVRGAFGAQAGVLKLAGDVGVPGKGGFSNSVDDRKKDVIKRADALERDEDELKEAINKKLGGDAGLQKLKRTNADARDSAENSKRDREAAEGRGDTVAATSFRNLENQARKVVQDTNKNISDLSNELTRQAKEESDIRMKFARNADTKLGSLSLNPGAAKALGDVAKKVRGKELDQQIADLFVAKMKEDGTAPGTAQARRRSIGSGVRETQGTVDKIVQALEATQAGREGAHVPTVEIRERVSTPGGGVLMQPSTGARVDQSSLRQPATRRELPSNSVTRSIPSIQTSAPAQTQTTTRQSVIPKTVPTPTATKNSNGNELIQQLRAREERVSRKETNQTLGAILAELKRQRSVSGETLQKTNRANEQTIRVTQQQEKETPFPGTPPEPPETT